MIVGFHPFPMGKSVIEKKKKRKKKNPSVTPSLRLQTSHTECSNVL